MSDMITADIYDSAVCDVALVISELLSNALRHAAPLPGSKVRVAWRVDAGSVQVSVSDGGAQTVPELGEPNQGATGGRGLRIVEKLSTRWGTSTGEDGTTVWAEVPVRPLQTRTQMTAVGGPAVAAESGLRADPAPPLAGVSGTFRMRSAELPGFRAPGTVGFRSWS